VKERVKGDGRGRGKKRGKGGKEGEGRRGRTLCSEHLVRGIR
jgi:hypothetical protein